MNKPKPLILTDSWNEYDSAWISVKIHRGDQGQCVKVEFQEDIESKDLWLKSEDAEKLGKKLIEYAKYLRKKK